MVTVTTTWENLNPKGPSAWVATRTAYDTKHGVGSFDALPSIDFGCACPSKNQAVREYLAR